MSSTEGLRKRFGNGVRDNAMIVVIEAEGALERTDKETRIAENSTVERLPDLRDVIIDMSKQTEAIKLLLEEMASANRKIPLEARTHKDHLGLFSRLLDYLQIPTRKPSESREKYIARLKWEKPRVYRDFLLYLISHTRTRFADEPFDLLKMVISAVVMYGTYLVLQPLFAALSSYAYKRIQAMAIRKGEEFKAWLYDDARRLLSEAVSMGTDMRIKRINDLMEHVVTLYNAVPSAGVMLDGLTTKGRGMLQKYGGGLFGSCYHSVASFRRPRLACDVEPSWNVPRHVRRAPMATFA